MVCTAGVLFCCYRRVRRDAYRAAAREAGTIEAEAPAVSHQITDLSDAVQYTALESGAESGKPAYAAVATVGESATVLTEFTSNDRARVLLEAGQQGVVWQVDDDGDVGIKFPHHPKGVWVLKRNFKHIRFGAAVTICH